MEQRVFCKEGRGQEVAWRALPAPFSVIFCFFRVPAPHFSGAGLFS